ncbi:PriCT-2 domain-containing protein [Sphaerospermopsis sp. FACHB-1194]|uniref:PriCT-2 domain-containing protein n=1 Tax=Sphaerospermopsis sp. FACHB-1194 TaxID=2692862 RepID=UPI001680DA1A|nr:PriCT-2 domain-containing protein [Sphaerospermopsis sp. FACHB-1194]MBD2148484.1 PriCT-2 domain-containing protein [Sphaerospermopsis sp. FACHB-1194]
MSQQQFNNQSNRQHTTAQQQFNNQSESQYPTEQQQFNNQSETQHPTEQKQFNNESNLQQTSTGQQFNNQWKQQNLADQQAQFSSEIKQETQHLSSPQHFYNSLETQHQTEQQQFHNQSELQPPTSQQIETPTEFKQQPELKKPTVQQPQFTPQLEPEPIQNDKISFAFNATGKNKDWDFRKLAANFQDTIGTIWDIISHVRAGHALCAGLLGGQWRSKANIIGSQWVLLDIDNSATWTDENNNPLDENGKPIKINRAWVDINGNIIEKSDGRQAKKIYQHQLTLDEALEHPFIKQYCALIYTTASHKPDWHKFRLVFVLPEYVQGAETVEVLTRYLMKHLPHDPACKDASRVFYGSTEATFPLINPNARLPQSWIAEAVTTAYQEKIEYEKRIAEITARRIQFQERAEANNWDIDQLIQQALTYIPSRSPGSNNYHECLQVLMALNSHYGPVDAEIIAEQWSPSIKGTTWNIRAKIKSFRGRSGITIATLFHTAKQYGFRFPTVEQKKHWGREQGAGQISTFLLPIQENTYKYAGFHSNYIGREGNNSRRKPFNNYQQETFNNYRTKYFGNNLHANATDPIISKQEWQAKYGIQDPIISKQEWQAKYGINRDAQEFIQTLITITNKAKRFIGNIVYQPEPITLPRTTHVDVDIWFGAKERKQTYIDAIKSGKKFILDLSHAGAGKSHTVGEFTPKQLEVKTLFYLSNEHRNPTVATIEQWTDLTVRHNGLVADYSKLTPLGNPEIHWPKPGEKTNIEGNCPLTHIFHILREKGYKAESTAEASFNPVCNGCRSRANCAGTDSEGNKLPRISGSTFRDDRRKALASDRIRANINSLPQPEDITEMKAIAFVDEVSRQLKPVDFIEAGLKDFDFALMEVQTRLPAVYDKIKGLILPLRALLTGQVPVLQETYYGYNDELIRELLGEVPANLPEIIAELETIAPDIEELVQQADSVTLDGVDKSDRESFNRKTLKFIRSYLNREATQKTYKNINDLPVRWLIPLLEVIGGIKAGALRVKNKRLIVATKNTHQIDVLKAFDFVFLMDATATRENIAMQLGINPDEILVICEIPPDYSNLTIHQITGFGLLGKERSEPLKKRLAALRKELDKRHDGNIAYIDHLAHKNQGDGHWFADNRGSNAYQDKQAICSFGTPYQDIGASEQVYITLTGDRNVGRQNICLQDFINDLVKNEVVQCAGRTRANRREEEEVIYYIVSDKDLSYLADYYPGAKLIKSDAFDICPEAGTQIQQTRRGIFEGFKQLVADGVTEWEKVTQEMLGKAAGISQEWISKIAKKYFGGWKSFRKLLLLLYNSLYRGSNNSLEILTQEQRWLIEEYLPILKQDREVGNESAEVVIEQVITFAEHLGWKGFSTAVNAACREIKAFLMDCLISVLPKEIHDEVKRSLVLYLAKVEPEY